MVESNTNYLSWSLLEQYISRLNVWRPNEGTNDDAGFQMRSGSDMYRTDLPAPEMMGWFELWTEPDVVGSCNRYEIWIENKVVEVTVPSDGICISDRFTFELIVSHEVFASE